MLLHAHCITGETDNFTPKLGNIILLYKTNINKCHEIGGNQK